MWLVYKSFEYYMPHTNLSFDHVLILSIDNGIAWNPYGKKSPRAGEWVFCNPETTVPYIKFLQENGYYCILHSNDKGSKSAIEEIEQIFLSCAIVGISMNALFEIIASNWVLNNGLTRPSRLSNNFDIISIPRIGSFPGFEIDEIPNLRWDAIKYLPNIRPLLIIMMGQPGSGKTTFSMKLQEKGFIIINEKIAGSLRRGQIKETKKFLIALKTSGLVIDSTNPDHKSRRIYANLASQIGIQTLICWCTRPGFRFNNMRDHKVPDVALYSYESNFENPIHHDIPFLRII